MQRVSHFLSTSFLCRVVSVDHRMNVILFISVIVFSGVARGGGGGGGGFGDSRPFLCQLIINYTVAHINTMSCTYTYHVIVDAFVLIQLPI